MCQHENRIAEIRFDTAENGPSKVCMLQRSLESAHVRVRAEGAVPLPVRGRPPPGRCLGSGAYRPRKHEFIFFFSAKMRLFAAKIHFWHAQIEKSTQLFAEKMYTIVCDESWKIKQPLKIFFFSCEKFSKFELIANRQLGWLLAAGTWSIKPMAFAATWSGASVLRFPAMWLKDPHSYLPFQIFLDCLRTFASLLASNLQFLPWTRP